MTDEQERQFEQLVPMRSVLGREFLALQYERTKQKQLFESSPEKLACDTLPYRRASIALGRFLDDWIPKVIEAQRKLSDGASERLEIAEAKAKDNSHGHGIELRRTDIKKIWMRFALERYQVFAKPLKKTFKKYHPAMWKDLNKSWHDFSREIRRWKYGGQDFDGSQAMSQMIDFQVKCRLLASHND